MEQLETTMIAEDKYLQLTENKTVTPEELTEQAKEEYALALSLEPTMEEICNLPSEAKKGNGTGGCTNDTQGIYNGIP